MDFNRTGTAFAVPVLLFVFQIRTCPDPIFFIENTSSVSGLFLAVQSYKFLQILVSFFCFLLIDREQFFSFLRICSLQCVVTNFSVKEFLIAVQFRLFAVQ